MLKRIMAVVMAVVLMCGSVDTSLLVYATNTESSAEGAEESSAEEEDGEESRDTESSEVEEPAEEEQENTGADAAEDEGESASSEEDSQPGDTEVVETEETAEELVSSFGASNIASGTDGNVNWTIDRNGKLTVTGTGEFSTSSDQDRSPWYSYRYNILKAEIYLSETTDLSYMFRHCSNLTSVDLSGFNPGIITDMSYMFSGCSSLESIDLSGLDTGSVTNMGNLFSDCYALSSVNLNNLDTGNVTDMSYMFSGCSSLENIDLSGFDTSSLTSMEGMFSWCSNLTNINLSGLETSNVTNMRSVFSFSSSLTKVDLSGLNTSSVMDMSGMFSYCSSLASVDLSNLNAGNVTNMNGMFSLCTSLTNIDLRGLDTSRLESMNNMFNGCSSLENIDLSSLDTSNVTAMGGMFSDCSSLASIDLSGFDTGNVTAMSSLFSRCSNLTDINLSGLDTGNVTDMSSMFFGCTSLTNIDLSGLDTTSVTNMSWMFCGCSSLASIDLSSFVTDSVTNMRGMFGTSGSLACSSLTSINLSGFETNSVTDMSRMFIGCSSLTSIDLSDFDTSSVTSMDNFFDSCDSLSYIKTPKNLNISVELYGSNWYMFDGTIVTELPQGLSYSVELAKDSIPEGGDPQYAKIVSLSPENGSNNQGYNAANTPTFSITFDREISGMDTPNNVTFADLDFDAGTLKIFRSMDDELIYEVTYDDYVNTFYGIEGTTSSDVSIINDVTFLLKPFNAHTLLDSSTEYYVTVDKGFIKFMDGTVNAAITKEMWTFQTEMLTTTADVTIKASDDVTTDISVDWTDSWFQNKTSTYCHELAIASIVLSSSAYVESSGKPASDSVEAALQDFGFDVEAYNYDYPLSDDDNDVVSFTFGEKNYEDTKLIAIIIKGTSGNEEWYSNFNISESKSDSNADHTGFRLAADDLIEQLEAYLDTLGNIDKSRIKFYVTGHSRGAGVANLVAATLTDKYTQNNVFAYTFAAPTVSKNATENGYENIYNIINEEDFVTQIPLSTWGFGRYGIDLALPSRSWKGKSYSTLAAKRDATYTSLIGEDYAEYLCGTFNVRCLVSAVNNLAPSVYAYYYLKHAFVYNSIYPWETTSGYFDNLAALLVGDSSLAYTYFVPSELGSYAPVTTFFLWSHKIRGQVFAAHSMAGYYSWMSSCTAEELFEDPQSSTYKTFKSLTVACPVDVYVYDESGELVASIVDEEIVVDELALNVEDGVKTIDMPSDQEYTVEVIAREDGEMDYVVEELSAEATGDTVLRTVTFSDVSIEAEDSFVGQIDSEFDASSTNYALTVNDSEIIYDDSVTYVKDIPDQTYTGSAITPEPVVVNGAMVLEKGKDYTVTYKNNTRIGTATITIKGKGNYTKTITASFEITPQDLAATAITATAVDKVTTAAVLDANGALLTKWYSYPTLKNGTATLRRGTDYTVDSFVVAEDDAENAYTVTVTLSGMGNYTGTREVTYRITGKSISGVLTTAVAAQTYTGSALEPEIAVYANSAAKNAETPLEEGTDYTVEYENNTAVGTGKLILTGIGAYSGTKTITFRIDKKGLAASKTDTDEITVQLRADETDNWVTPSEYSAKYSGSAQKPYVQVIYKPSGSEDNDAVTLVEGTDYRLSWKNNVNAVQTTTKSSSYPTVTITGLGNYSGSRSVTFEIAPLELTDNNTEITVSDVQYTAAVGRSGAKPSVTVKVTLDDGDTWATLKSGTAYTVASYADNTSVGENAKVYIAGKGNYTTTEPVEKTFRIYESAANNLYVTVTAPTGNSGMVYTGDEIQPTVSVYKNKTDQRNNTNALTENTDYTVSYANNTNAGNSAQVLVSGLGTYGGTKTVTFRIARQSLAGGSVDPYADESSSYTYTGSAISLTETQLSVTDSNDRELILGTDYTVSYRNNTNAGIAQITVTGKGNYSGSLKSSFTISPLTLTDENTTISVSDVKYTAAIGRSGAKPTVTVKVTTDAGKTLTLKKNTAYTVSYSGNKEIGSATVSITGKGNFSTAEDSGLSEEFRIYKNAASSLYVVLEDSPYYYSGSQIKPTISVYTKRGGVLLDESYYEVDYGTNKNIGTGKIYITGTGDYGGTKTVNFTILPKWLKWFL